MCLDAVSLLIVVGQVEEFKGQVGPDPTHGFLIQLTDVNNLLLKTQYMSSVDILGNIFI